MSVLKIFPLCFLSLFLSSQFVFRQSAVQIVDWKYQSYPFENYNVVDLDIVSTSNFISIIMAFSLNILFQFSYCEFHSP